MNKKSIIFILLIISVIVFFIYFQKINKKVENQNLKIIPFSESKQEYIIENMLDSLNEEFKEQAKIIGGQSIIELRNDLSYVYQNGKENGLNGICVKYSKITSTGQQINFPTFSFGPEYKKNIDYKSVGDKDYSVFYKEKKISCDVVYKDQTLNICCLYYKGQDPRTN